MFNYRYHVVYLPGLITVEKAGLWIRIHFLRIRIQLFFSKRTWIQMRIRVLSQPYKICKIKLACKVLKKTKKIAQKLKTMKLVHM